MVKKVGALKIIHEKYRAKRTHADYQQFLKSFDMLVQTNPDTKAHLSKAQDDLNPLKVREMFQRISAEVVFQL